MTARPGPVRQNVLYSLAEFGSLPLLMLATAPMLLRSLGQQQYGTWMLVNSVAATAGGLGGGFGDAATRYIALHRGRGDRLGVNRSLFAVLLINCVLGTIASATVITLAPFLVDEVFKIGPALRGEAVSAIRIAGLILALRFPAAVFMSATRAYERYRPVVLVTVLSRAVLMIGAVALARNGFGLLSILLTTVIVEAASLAAQAVITITLIGVRVPSSSHLIQGLKEVLEFGLFTGLKSAVSVMFGHADRLLVGALLGVAPLAIYVLCNQVAQFIPAVIASGFNFLFPNLTAALGTEGMNSAERSYRRASAIAVGLVAAMSFVLWIVGQRLLRVWIGGSSPEQYPGLLAALIAGYSLLALSVVPQYTALSLGRSRQLAMVNVVAGAASLAVGYALLRHIGVLGIGLAKVVAGGISLSVIPIVTTAFRPQRTIQRALHESVS